MQLASIPHVIIFVLDLRGYLGLLALESIRGLVVALKLCPCSFMSNGSNILVAGGAAQAISSWRRLVVLSGTYVLLVNRRRRPLAPCFQNISKLNSSCGHGVDRGEHGEEVHQPGELPLHSASPSLFLPLAARRSVVKNFPPPVQILRWRTAAVGQVLVLPSHPSGLVTWLPSAQPADRNATECLPVLFSCIMYFNK